MNGICCQVKKFATFQVLEMFIKHHNLPGTDLAEHIWKETCLSLNFKGSFELGSFCKLIFLRKGREVLSLTVAMLNSFLDHSRDLLFKL